MIHANDFSMSNSNLQKSSLHETYIKIDQEQIELFAARLIRHQILIQHVESDHPVLLSENKLIQQSEDAIFQKVDNIDLCTQNKCLLITSTLIRIRNAIRLQTNLHDLEDEDMIETVIFGAAQEAYVRISKFIPRKACASESRKIVNSTSVI